MSTSFGTTGNPYIGLALSLETARDVGRATVAIDNAVTQQAEAV